MDPVEQERLRSELELRNACTKGDLTTVKQLLTRARHSDLINAELHEGQAVVNPLMLAAKYGHKALVNYLLTRPNLSAGTVMNLSEKSAFGYALKAFDNFKNANYIIAATLINAAFRFQDNKCYRNNCMRTTCFNDIRWSYAWCFKNPEVAVRLNLILGADFQIVVDRNVPSLMTKAEHARISQQIEYTRKSWIEVKEAKLLGVEIERMGLSVKFKQTIAEFLFNPLEMRAFEAGCTTVQERSRSFTVMRNALNEIQWQQWQTAYSADPNRAKAPSFGPGAMVPYRWHSK